MTKPRIAVIGGGLMGAGISSQTFAAAGHEVCVQEPFGTARSSILERVKADLRLMGADATAADRIETIDDLGAAVAGADYITEAAPERVELKHAIFAELVAKAPQTANLASDTSVIPIELKTAHGFRTGAPSDMIDLREKLVAHLLRAQRENTG